MSVSLFRGLGVNLPAGSGSMSMYAGYFLSPFSNTATGKTYCPNSSEDKLFGPLSTILRDYTGETEALYYAEKEAEVIGNESVTGNMFINKTNLMKYGFYLQNGSKVRVDENSIHARTVFYYWPASSQMDPLEKRNRKLFTVKSNQGQTTDKRIGCVPKKDMNYE